MVLGTADDRGEPRRSRAQEIATDLEERILGERLGNGTRIGLRTDLIEHYRASPAVMNEALRILRERDLVEVKTGPTGGVFVTNPPPQVRLGGIDVWHQTMSVDPEQLFESRRLMDNMFATTALQRATPEDIREMEWAIEEIRQAQNDAYALLNATMRLHLAIARSSRIDVLVGMYQTIVVKLSTTMTRARFVPGQQDLRRHNLELHVGLVDAIRARDGFSLEKFLAEHELDMERLV
jgi:DNA-binding FadR family transcriptional regulator